MSEFSKLNGYDVKDKKAIRYYDTVEDMKSDITLKTNMCAITKGYHNINDGGGAEYNITDTIVNTDWQETLNNNLYASLIIKESVNVKQFGAYGDDTHDDTISLQNAINYVIANYPHELIIPGGTYKITSKITINDRCIIKGFGTTNPSITSYNENAYVEIAKSSYIYRLRIENISFYANNVAKYGLYCEHITESYFKNIEVGTGATISAFYGKFLNINTFQDCIFRSSPIGLYMDNACTHNIFYNSNFWNNATMIKCVSDNTSNIFIANWFEKWNTHFMDMTEASNINQMCFNNCYFLQSNSDQTKSDIYTDTTDELNYQIRFNTCIFLFPHVTDSTSSLFNLSANSWTKLKYLDILDCTLLIKGSMKSWVDDSQVITKQQMRVDFTNTKYANIPYTSNNKCAMQGLYNLDYLGQQGFKNWIVLPGKNEKAFSNFPSNTNGTIYYDDDTGLINLKSSLATSSPSPIPICPQNRNISNSTATDVATLVNDYNALLTILANSKIINII